MMYADLAKRRCKDLLGEKAFSHLSQDGRSALKMFFEIQHTDKDYYKKMAGVYVKVNEAIG
jgi:hypothetical protein